MTSTDPAGHYEETHEGMTFVPAEPNYDEPRGIDPRGPGAAFALAVYGPDAFRPARESLDVPAGQDGAPQPSPDSLAGWGFTIEPSWSWEIRDGMGELVQQGFESAADASDWLESLQEMYLPADDLYVLLASVDTKSVATIIHPRRGLTQVRCADLSEV